MVLLITRDASQQQKKNFQDSIQTVYINIKKATLNVKWDGGDRDHRY